MNPSLPKEKDVQKAIQDLLTAKKIMWFRMNAGDRFGETNGKKWRIRGHAPGTADLLAFISMGDGGFVPCDDEPALLENRRRLVPLWIEVKAPGKKLRDEQVEFRDEVQEYGCSHIWAGSIDTVVEWLKVRGL